MQCSFWPRWAWMLGLALLGASVGAATQPGWLGWAGAALTPLVAWVIPYLRVVPWLFELRWRRAAARQCRQLAELEDALAQATTATALRRQLGLLDTARATVHALARTLPASCQGELLFWRWHLDLVRREARRRLRRLSRRSYCG